MTYPPFRCGHPRDSTNVTPNGTCRTCYNERLKLYMRAKREKAKESA